MFREEVGTTTENLAQFDIAGTESFQIAAKCSGGNSPHHESSWSVPCEEGEPGGLGQKNQYSDHPPESNEDSSSSDAEIPQGRIPPLRISLRTRVLADSQR